MTHVELCKAVAKRLKGRVSEELVKEVLDTVVDTSMEMMADGDEVKVKGLGTFRPSPYSVWKGKLEFGTTSNGGRRVRLRFKPFESTNVKLTNNWHDGSVTKR